MNELNAEQIKKALGCCYMQELEHNENCPECPYTDLYPNCSEYLGKDALVLIKELTEENEAISERYAIQVVTAIELDKQVQRLTEENERLQKALNTDISIVRVSRGNGKTAHLRELGRIKVDAIRADTVREMQERFNDKVAKLLMSPSLQYQASAFIDQIAKEMLEDTK